MKIAELKQMKNGCKVLISEGKGWYREATFIKIVNVTTFGRITFDDLMAGNIDMNGRKKTEAVVRVIDDNGKERTMYINPRTICRKEALA